MGLTEIFLTISILLNWWQWGEQAELKTELKQQTAIAQTCQETKENARELEIRSADERAMVLEDARRIFSESEQHLRRTVENGSAGCDRMDSPGGSERVEEFINRNERINRKWLRTPSSFIDE